MVNPFKHGIRAFVTWAWDWAIEHWPALTLAIVSGGGMTYLAAVSQWLNQYGPVAWGFAGLIGLGLAALVYWLYSSAVHRLAMSAYVGLLSKTSDAINPLDNVFNRRRIKIQDLIDPFTHEVRGKTFTDCDLVGPANIFFEGVGTLNGVGFYNCNCVLANRNFVPNTISRFTDVHIIRGRIIAATLFMSPGMKAAMGDLADHPDAQWVNQ